MTVLNPFRRVNEHIMDDADLAGPLIFCFCFATFLLFVSVLSRVTFCSV
jgi:protein YIPF5/7